MGLFDVFKSPDKIKADYGAFSKALGGGILDQISGALRTEEAVGTYRQAADLTQTFLDEYREFDREGGLTQASLAASRRDIFRSGAMIGGGRRSAMEIAGAMNQMKAQQYMMLEQSRASLRGALTSAMAVQNQAAGAFNLSPAINTILGGAAQMSMAEMQANAQAQAAHKAMMGKIIGGVMMAAAGPAGAGMMAMTSGLSYAQSVGVMQGLDPNLIAAAGGQGE